MMSLLATILCVPATFAVDPPSVVLDGPGASHCLLVSRQRADGQTIDRTHAARYVSRQPDIVRVDSRGVLHAVRDGNATIAITDDKDTREVRVEVKNTTTPRNLHFTNDIIPLLSRYGCNSSGCHGKAEGQAGFKLSVFGFDPAADYASLVHEGRGRRLLPSSPAASLLIQKMSGGVAHGGGARLRSGTLGYDTMVQWIADGMPIGAKDAPVVESVRVSPAERVLDPRGTQQLRVIAKYSDGRIVDVSARAKFVSNNDTLASVDAEGLVTAGEVPGEAAVMVSFMNVFDVCRVLVPRTQRIAKYPSLPENNFIDRLVHARLQKLHILPSETCDDSTYLRRVYLDVIGTLPTVAEVRKFLADKKPTKRADVVETLLARSEFADYWALKWADLLRVDRAALGAKSARAYHQWIRSQLAENAPLDKLARAIVTAEGPLEEVPEASFYKAAKKPGEMASTLAQVFLGVRIACAECHHHPFDRWSQEDYHGMAAYFANVRVSKSKTSETLVVAGMATSRHPRTGEVIYAHGLAEKRPGTLESGDQRETLARWLTSKDNPWFARNLANRVWAQFMGRGLVEPLDDVRATNPPTNPELLDALAKHLSESKFDLKALIRAITASRAYQRSTTPNATNERDALNYSRSLMRRVPAEVLLDMVSQTTGVAERFRGAEVGTRAIQLWDSKVPHYFLKAFGRTERTSACECERNPEPSVAQVLHLLNAPEIESKLTHAGGTVAKLLRREKEDARVVEELYLAFYAREPSEREKKLALGHLKENAARRKEAVEDLAWSLMNALEFGFNH